MGVLIDGHNHKVFVEEIDLLGPLADPVVSLLRGGEIRIILHGMMFVFVLAGRAGGEPLVEVGGEDVGLLQHRLPILIFPELKVSKQMQSRVFIFLNSLTSFV